VEKKLEAVLERYAATKRVRESKIVLGSITKIRRMGNIRITLDDMVLKLGGAVK
jgi:hypothetical protein